VFHNAINLPDPQAITEEVEASAAWLKRLVDAEIYAVLTDGLDIADRRLQTLDLEFGISFDILQDEQIYHTLISGCASVSTSSAAKLSRLSLTFDDR
jgi:hypothetical protein